MQEDANLVRQTIKGDEKAFHRLIMKYYTDIHAQILSWVNNPEDAKDIVQDVFLEAYQGLSSLRKPEQFCFWLRQIAKYHFQDWLRKKQTFVELDDHIADKSKSADELMILRETITKMMQAIDELPESERRLLKERYLDEASYDKLEAKYGLSQSVLSMRLYRARQRVRERLKMLTGVLALTWRDAVRRIITGGSLAMKIGAKVKIIIAIASAVVILGGTGFVVWHYQRPSQEIISDSFDDQTIQKATLPSDKEQTSNKSVAVSDTGINKSPNNEGEDADITEAFDQLIALMEESTDTDNSNADPKLTKKIEVYSGLMRLLPAYKQATQSGDDLTKEMQNLMNVEVEDFLYDRDRFPEIGRISYGPDGIKVFDKQEKELTYNPEIKEFVDDVNRRNKEIQEKMKLTASKITSLLQEIDDLCPRKEFEGWTSETPPRRIIGVVSRGHKGELIAIDEYRLAKWLGKELPGMVI